MGFLKFMYLIVSITAIINTFVVSFIDIPLVIKATGYAVENTIRGNR